MNYDQYIQEKIVKELNCFPIYWSDILPNTQKLNPCNSVQDINKTFNYINNLKPFFDANDKPCEEMLVLVGNRINKRFEPHLKDMTVAFIYTNRYYERVEYSRAFGFESFWSGIGGFVGIFLGYSMMQIPEFIAHFISLFLKLKNNIVARKFKFS